SISAGAEAECVATKVAMPVPGYPLGFVKNPDVLTYYAVKGESQFVGLFNPFNSNHITLKAFAAAKPFGGRIGPMLFNVEHAEKVRARQASGSFTKSSPYISRMKNTPPVDRFGNPASVGPNGVEYQAGMPIPGDYVGSAGPFWLVDDSSAIGGNAQGEEITYGIPNIPFDYPNAGSDQAPKQFSNYFSASPTQEITPVGKNDTPDSAAGLYNQAIFKNLKSKLSGLGSTGQISIDNIKNAITLSRAPTFYDVNNYLVPSPEVVNEQIGTDSYGVISDRNPENVQGHKVYDMALYAPLMSSDGLYQTPTNLAQIFNEYIVNQRQSVKKYRGAMNIAAKLIYEKNISQTTDAAYGEAAAQMLSYFKIDSGSNPYTDSDPIYDKPPGCNSINGRFVWFFSGDSDLVNDDIGVDKD
ncbi:MAG: hypothetical protein WD025_01940, partial [Bacteriovoracaceae bacterium]